MRRTSAAVGLLLVVTGLWAFWGVWRGSYIFDDQGAIAANAPLVAGDWWEAAFGAKHQPLANRPLSCASLVADFRLHGPGPFGPHLGNLLLHLVNALLLFAAVRATLRAPILAGRFDPPRATWFAAAIAVLWVVHPLAVDAVAYATQRSTLLFSGCLLLALFATARAATSPRSGWWRLLTVLALAAGMASKEDMVLGPVVVVLFERAFVVPSWRLLRARWRWHAALASSWLVLAACVALGPSNPTVGFGTPVKVTAFEWLCTQAGVVVHYLRLSVRPQPLRGAYDWDIVRSVTDAMLPGLLVLALIAVTVVLWRRRPWWGWLGSLFFLLLAPTSSVLPIISELVAERRVYLPMLAVIVPVVFGVHRLATRIPGRQRGVVLIVLAALAVTALALTTRVRVEVYSTAAAFWGDAYAKRDPASRSFVAGILLANQGLVLCQTGRLAEGYACYVEAMQCEAPPEGTVSLYALSLAQSGRTAEAVELMRRLVASEPVPHARGILGVCLVLQNQAEKGPVADPRLVEAERELRVQLAVKPNDVQCRPALAHLQRRLAEAVAGYQKAAEREPDNAETVFRCVPLLARLDRTAEIGPMFDRLLAARPRDVDLRLRLAQLGIQNRDQGTAQRMLQQVLELAPGHAQAQAMLRELGPAAR